MGTHYNVTVAGVSLPSDALRSLKAEVDGLLKRINKQMSTYDPESELSRFNASRELTPFPVSPETARVVHTALLFSKETKGAFDPTVGPLVNLWGFGPEKRTGELPDPAKIRAVLPSVGYWHLKASLNPPSLRKNVPGLYLDLSAIAKGFGVDEVGRLLESKGYTNFLVEIGGEIVAKGKNPKGEPWRVGIDRPTPGSQPGAAFEAYARIGNGALATSGDYRNYFTKDGIRFSHFVDPRTAGPIRHRLASASVLAPNCMLADAAATAVMILGPVQGRAYIEGKQGWEALFMVAEKDGSFTGLTTNGFPRE